MTWLAVAVKVAQSCPTLWDPTDYTVHGILQARILKWVAFPFSRGSSQTRNRTRSPALQVDSLPTELSGKPKLKTYVTESHSIRFKKFKHQEFFMLNFLKLLTNFLSVQFSSVAQSCQTLCDPIDHSRPPCPSPTPWSLLKLMSIELVMPSSHLIFCRPLLLPPSVFPSIRVFAYESVLLIRWPKYWSFSFSISPSNEYSGLISFRMDWLDLLAVQVTLKSLLQCHSSKASIRRVHLDLLRTLVTTLNTLWKLFT